MQYQRPDYSEFKRMWQNAKEWDEYADRHARRTTGQDLLVGGLAFAILVFGLPWLLGAIVTAFQH